jgi:hypothetical protein
VTSPIPFPTLTEAALKTDDYQTAALTLRITPDTPKEVLQYAASIIFLRMHGLVNVETYTDFRRTADEITQASQRLIEIAEFLPYAPVDQGAHRRILAWHVEHGTQEPAI